MANILGIIAEYNPLHNGHIYHIQKAKEQIDADYTIAVLTGNFTQRGNTSVINKWEKTKMALAGGVDVVIELPTLYSISSAENFANGAIKILSELKVVTHISFGMEEDDIASLNNIANVLVSENTEFTSLLRSKLKEGLSFPKAREIAIVNYFKDKKYEQIMQGSNNILAIEYLKAIKKINKNIKPIGIKREKVFYNSKKIIDEYASSSGIRNLLLNKQLEETTKVMPSESFDILYDNVKNGTYCFDINNLSQMIFYKLRNMSIKELSNLPEVSEGIENLIKENSNKTNNLQELIEKCKSKRYTQTRIQRILLYALLDINKQDMEMSKKIKPYIRILGCNERSKWILSEIKNNATLITSVKKFEDGNTNKKYKRMLEIDKKASNIYTLGYKKNSEANLDYTKGLIGQWGLVNGDGSN